MKKEELKRILAYIELSVAISIVLFYFLASTAIQKNPVLSGHYWLVSVLILFVLSIIFVLSYQRYLNDQNSIIVSIILQIRRYRFLIEQLVSRDFKTKYKRSVLGVIWSLLNPLLTMTIQFFVFSTIFNADVKSYPVYLLSGVICFNFFSECTNMCLVSITNNSHLINKVYIPKYIFPLSKCMSSIINLSLTMIPLIIVSLLMGLSLRFQALLSIYFILCLIVFSFGIGLLLSALMVFFRDIQFLWSVIIQAWQYATPIFYIAEIIPEKYSFILKINPLYHMIGNFRTCFMDGLSPRIGAYVACGLFALTSLCIGSFVFKKLQDNFTTYI